VGHRLAQRPEASLQSVDSDFLSLDKAITIGYNAAWYGAGSHIVQAERFADVLQRIDQALSKLNERSGNIYENKG
jgi:hypothetical protein